MNNSHLWPGEDIAVAEEGRRRAQRRLPHAALRQEELGEELQKVVYIYIHVCLGGKQFVWIMIGAENPSSSYFRKVRV